MSLDEYHNIRNCHKFKLEPIKDRNTSAIRDGQITERAVPQSASKLVRIPLLSGGPACKRREARQVLVGVVCVRNRFDELAFLLLAQRSSELSERWRSFPRPNARLFSPCLTSSEPKLLTLIERIDELSPRCGVLVYLAVVRPTFCYLYLFSRPQGPARIRGIFGEILLQGLPARSTQRNVSLNLKSRYLVFPDMVTGPIHRTYKHATAEGVSSAYKPS